MLGKGGSQQNDSWRSVGQLVKPKSDLVKFQILMALRYSVTCPGVMRPTGMCPNCRLLTVTAVTRLLGWKVTRSSVIEIIFAVRK